MGCKVLNGKDLAIRIKSELKSEVGVLKEKGIFPGLAVIIVGNDPASRCMLIQKKAVKRLEYNLLNMRR